MTLVESMLMALVLSLGVILFITVMVTTLGPNQSLLNDQFRPEKDEAGFLSRTFTAAHKLGVTLMSALDEALARFTSFAKNVLDQIKVARDTNDAQTLKLAELQVALDTALADDAADKAAIATLQSEISTLQDAVAAQINAAVDALETVPDPVEEVPVEEVPVEEVPVEEVPVVEEDEVPVEESTTPPVE